MSTQGTTPSAYTPSSLPTIDGGIPTYTQRELLKIAAALAQTTTLTPQSCDKSPVNPIVGMQRLALAPWRPVSGQTTDRWVTYHGGAWVYLNSL